MNVLMKGTWLLGLVTALGVLTRPPEGAKRQHLVPLLPHADLLKIVGAAHLNLLADYYWIQCIQAIGNARTQEEYRDIYFFADLATTLDPDFEVIYRVAGTSIPHNLGRETWVNTRESSAILEKGLKRFPDSLQLRILRSYNLSFFDKDFIRAAEVLEKAALLPGAPRYLGPLSTRLYAQGGQVDSGLSLARSMLDIETDPDVKKVYEKRIRQLETERVLQQVDRAIAAYRSKQGSDPVTIIQLVTEGLLPPVLVDPSGGVIYIDEHGVAQSSAEKRLEVHIDRQSEGASP